MLAIKGTGRLQATVTQSDNQVLITLPEAELALAKVHWPPGTLQGVGTFSGSWIAKGVVVTVTLSEPTLTVTADTGELTLVLPYRGEVEYEQQAAVRFLASPLPARCLTFGTTKAARIARYSFADCGRPWIRPSGAEQSANQSSEDSRQPDRVNIIEQHRVTKFSSLPLLEA